MLHKNIVSVIRHIQLSNMGPIPKWSDKWHSTVLDVHNDKNEWCDQVVRGIVSSLNVTWNMVLLVDTVYRPFRRWDVEENMPHWERVDTFEKSKVYQGVSTVVVCCVWL